MATMIDVIQKQFTLVGARVKIGSEPRNDDFTINVGHDKKGEFFDLQVKKNVELMVQDTQRSDKHLLLIKKTPGTHKHFDQKERFLCGHDERHWFCATIPTAVTTVASAKQALKPEEIVHLEERMGLRSKNTHKRHKKLKSGLTMHRQGEFFFVPEPGFKPDIRMIIKNEPMSGGGGHVHTAQFLYRSGGETVWVSHFGSIKQQILSVAEYNRLTAAQRTPFVQRKAGATVYVKGNVSHIEHATVRLGDVWHRVHVNTEHRSSSRRFGTSQFAMSQMALNGGSNRFLD